MNAGSTTFKAEFLDRGLEPDTCFYLANAHRLRHYDDEHRMDLAIDPVPDLAIEVEITHALLNKLPIYAALGIPEIWHYRPKGLRVLILGAEGSYTESETSASFPFVPMADVNRLVVENDGTNDTRWARGVSPVGPRRGRAALSRPMMGTFVGIDLGTTNSVVASRNAYGRPEVIPNREGHGVTPSVIYFGTDPPSVGQEAKEYARLGDDQIASFFKPHMGSPLYRLQFHGKDYSATDLSAIVLKRLKQDAETALGQAVSHAVITVPAYFADAKRKATIDAGRLAGLDVLRIINEPTAAALAYGLQKPGVEETVLIYDLGGGTFDVTVARILPDEIAVLSTVGDHDLGGKNWDDRIATFLAEKFAQETGLDPLDDPLALNEVLVRSEQAKWALSERNSTRITLQIGAERRSYELSRVEFEGMTFPLMDRTRRLTEEALEEAKLSWKTLTGVLLVGGSTRMPMVRQYVTQMAGSQPRAGVNVDEVVALGAAIQAAMDSGVSSDSASPKFTLSAPARSPT